MNGKILQLSTKYLAPLLFVFSALLLFRGHNLPGGGFIGGLMAAVAFSLLLITYGSEKTKTMLRFDPRSLIGFGLLMSLASALYPAWAGKTFFKGLWTTIDLPSGMKVSLGTPLLFDLGIYMVVLGTLMIILLSLLEE